MLTFKTAGKREPIRDSKIHDVITSKLSGSLDKSFENPVDTQFVRAFAWFPNSALPAFLQPLLVAYIKWTQTFIADPRDTIFVSHILSSLVTVVPSALLLLLRFSWTHAILHTVLLIGTIPPYILMLHCTCHKKLTKGSGAGWPDFMINYFLSPFYGETWNTFYYHHVKHHHVEDNGPEDLSSTIWYDRDNWLHFAVYFFRFYFLIGLELPYYFVKKGQTKWAVNCFVGEYGTLVFLASFFWVCADPRSVIFAWFVPLNLARIGMMSGNWTQHAFLAQDDPKNDLKTALTVIETPYNATAFNDGYHTSHHLNPIRHWQDHPEHFVQNAEKFRDSKVVIFKQIDYWGLWCMLMVRNYDVLAKHFVDLTGKMSKADKIAWLKARTKRLTAEQIEAAYSKGKKTE
ncbi:hypothetical protein HDU91_007310 [Kappamyces sp. JEL0680]|nr:hypothetical protein HDU91_007310 [Kappamyces sp. JEL0680]